MHDMMFQGVQFPEAPGRRDEQAAPPPSDDNWVTVGEIDFLGLSAGHHQDHDDNNIHGSKKDNSHGEEAPRPGLDVDIGLHLCTANTGSDQSMVDDGISLDAKDKPEDPKVKLADAENKLAKSESQVAKLQTELQNVNLEIRWLKDRLAQVTNNNSVLPMNPVSPWNASKNREGKRVRLEESPESESQGWNRNKIPKLNPAIDQSAGATMMKPRVSDRARSEASMVSQDMGHYQLVPQAPQSRRQPHQPQQPQSSLADMVSATEAIITDPNFTAGLAATISSIISGAHPNDNIDNNNNKINNSYNDNNNNNKINNSYNDNNNNKINNDNNNNTTTNINFSSHPSSEELIQTTTTTTTKVTTTIYPFLRDKFMRS